MAPLNRIDETFSTARSQNQVIFIPFLTAGDPDLPTTVALAAAILETGESAGVPMILEVGFPYSDPIADGPTIQASYTRALQRGVRIGAILEAVAELRARCNAPLVAMVAFSLVHKQGGAAFLVRARQAGFDGVVIPDLPVEEAGAVCQFAAASDFKVIQLVAPTTPPERADRIVRAAAGFVYFVSTTGITGERDRLPEALPQRLAQLRQLTPLPICVGFGIGKPNQVRLLRPIVDGIIVGSAIVRQLESLRPNDASGISAIARFVAALIDPLRPDSTTRGA